MELFHAANQWATRPADERFTSLEEMHRVTKAYADRAAEKDVPWSDLRVESTGDELQVIGRAGVPAVLTNYAFKQLSARAGAPAGYLAGLPGTLAAQNLNHGLKAKADSTVARLLFHNNAKLVLRAATSDMYSRIWNHEVISRLIETAQAQNLVPARQTFSWDGSPVQDDGRRSLYASDHDMFAFMMSEGRVVIDPMGHNMYRGIIVTNSEVGDRSLGIMGFLFLDVCGNHIIWGAQQIAEVRIAHVGEIQKKWREAQVRVRTYLDASTSFEKAHFTQWMRQIAATKEDVLDAVFGKRTVGLSRSRLEASYNAVLPDVDGDPKTPWGLAQGITRLSQQTGYTDERHEMDRAAGRLLSITF